MNSRLSGSTTCFRFAQQQNAQSFVYLSVEGTPTCSTALLRRLLDISLVIECGPDPSASSPSLNFTVSRRLQLVNAPYPSTLSEAGNSTRSRPLTERAQADRFELLGEFYVSQVLALVKSTVSLS